MTDEVTERIAKRDKIVRDGDVEGLFLLNDRSDFSVGLHEILMKQYNKNAQSLNTVQLNLFLCMHIENAGQADHILSFLQECFPEYQEQVVTSFNEIGAIKSAEIIKQAIELLPEDGSWFFETSNEDSEKLMEKLDSEFSDYPDGFMKDLYFKYASKNRSKFIF